MANAGTVNAKALFGLLLLAGFFGPAFLLMKVLNDEISPLEIVAGRLTIAAVAVLAITLAAGKRLRFDVPTLARVTPLALMDSVLPFTLVAWAETRIDSGVAGVLISTMPIFTVMFAAAALPEERRAPARFLGIPLGFLGVVALSGGDVLDVTSGNAVGQLAVVGAGASYGVSAVYARFLLRKDDALTLTGPKLVSGAVMAAAAAVAVGGAPGYGALSGQGWLALATLGVVCTALAFITYLWLVGATGSVFASLVTYVIPIIALVLGWAVLGEGIGANTAAGAALIAAGVAGVMYGPALSGRVRAALARPAAPITARPLAAKEVA
jgi:drug/metabolite transporter (DMT)-like permease